MSLRVRSSFVVLVTALAPLGGLMAGDDGCSVTEAIVQLRPGASLSAFNGRFGTQTIGSIPGTTVHRLRLPKGTEFGEFAPLAQKDAAVQYIDANCIATDTNPRGGTQSIFFFSSEEQYTWQPALDVIVTDDDVAGSRGLGVTVAILDSGIGPHTRLAPRVLSGYDFVRRTTDTRDLPQGLDADGDGIADEMVGHGTLAAGLVHRLAPQAALLPVRIMDSDGYSTTFLMLEGIHYALHRGADVINLSLGTPVSAATLAEAIRTAEARGVAVVASVGNESTDNPRAYPAALSDTGVIAVAGTTSADRRADFSNFGTHVSLCAPGVNITSTVPGSAYGSASGTSFAAPLVCGALAVMRAAAPQAGVGALRRALFETSIRIDALNPGFEGQLGHGRLDVRRAVHRIRCAAASTDVRSNPPQNAIEPDVSIDLWPALSDCLDQIAIETAPNFGPQR